MRLLAGAALTVGLSLPMPVPQANAEATFNCSSSATVPEAKGFVADEIFGDGFGWCGDPTVDLQVVTSIEMSEFGVEWVAVGASGLDVRLNAGSGEAASATGVTECPQIEVFHYRTRNTTIGISHGGEHKTTIARSGSALIPCRLLNIEP